MRAAVPIRREERPAVPAPVRSLETARALANAGDGVAAAEMLDGMAATAAADPEYFCLRGVLSETLGCPDLAETCYRKALYLDPAHLETLTHLAALLEVSGRREAAAQLRRRANRSSHP
jgi:chemotaxis protein methyltransferase WspC